MRVAVVDIGTNSTRLLVADVRDGGVEELDRRSVVTRLGEDVDATGRLADAAQERVFERLAEYAESIERHDCERRLAVLTSAVRDADNGAAFADAVRERFGLDARTLSGDEEARLTYLGATAARDAGAEPLLVVDIGGGSTELVTGARGEMDFHVSTQAGVVRHTERFLRDDPPAREDVDALARDVRAVFEEAVPASRARARAGGGGGRRHGHVGGRDRRRDRALRPRPRRGRRRASLPPRRDLRYPRRRSRSRSEGPCRVCTRTGRPPSWPGRSSWARCWRRSGSIASRLRNGTSCGARRSTSHLNPDWRFWTSVRLSAACSRRGYCSCRMGGRASRRRLPDA